MNPVTNQIVRGKQNESSHGAWAGRYTHVTGKAQRMPVQGDRTP